MSIYLKTIILCILFFLYGCSDSNTNWEKSSEVDKMSDKETIVFKRTIVSEEGNKFDLTLVCPSRKNDRTTLYLAGSSLKTYSSSIIRGQYFAELSFKLDGKLMKDKKGNKAIVSAVKDEDQSKLYKLSINNPFTDGFLGWKVKQIFSAKKVMMEVDMYYDGKDIFEFENAVNPMELCFK